MKKLLIFMLVLGLASTASAVVVTEFTLQSDGLVLEVVGTADVTVNGYYILSGPAIDIAVPQGGGYPIWHTDVSNLGKNDYVAGDLAAITIMAAGDPFGDVAQFYAMTSLPGAYPDDSVDSGLWYTIDIDNVDTTGWTLGQVVDTLTILNDQAVEVGTVDVTSTIPEPMTIALLGLGGLFLLRRRK